MFEPLSDKLKAINENASDISWEKLEEILARVTEISLDSGVADSGSVTVIRDTAKGWAVNMWTDATAHCIIGL